MLLNNYYWYFKEIIPHHICDKIIRYGLEKNQQLAYVGGEAPKAPLSKKETKQLKKTRYSMVSWIDDPWIYHQIHPFVRVANENAGWNYQWDFSEACQFTKYGLNQHYNWHCDMMQNPYQEGPAKGHIRKLSLTLSLSDANDYKGGELEFDFKNVESKKCKPVICHEIKSKGSIVVFPSYVWHRVRPVTEGTRYSLVNWNLGWPYK